MNDLKLALLFILSFISLGLLQAQQVENVAVSSNDEQLIITYDLEGKVNTIYDIQLQLQMEDGSIIKPKALNGDIGKVEVGKGKAIVWDVYDDVNGVSGKITPIIDAKEIVKRNPKATTPTQPTPTPPAPPQRPTVDVDKKKKKKKRQRTYRTGVKAAWGRSSVESNLRRDKFGELRSWEVGPYFRWTFRKRMYIQPEILYHRQSYEEVYNTTEFSESNNHYVRAQAVAGFSPFGWGLYVNGGLYYGHLFAAKEQRFLATGTEEITLDNIEIQNGQDNRFRNGDFGFLVGGSFSIFKGSFAIGGLYSAGFDNFLNQDYYSGDVENNNWSLKNRGVHFFIQKTF